MIGSYDYWLVALSVMLAASACYMALDLAGPRTAAIGPSRALWLSGGALVMGLGIWSMDFVGLLAINLPVAVYYHVPTVELSLVAAILTSGFALFVSSRERLRLHTAALASVVLGGAIAALSYLGIAAMRMAGRAHWHPGLVTLSVAIAVLVSFGVFWLAYRSQFDRRPLSPLRLASAGLMGAAFAATHYLAMAATSFEPAATPDLSHAIDISGLGVVGISVVTFMTLALAALTSIADRRLSQQAHELRAREERYRLLFNRSLAGVYQSTLDGRLLDCNDAFARILGYASRDECLAHAVADLYERPEDREPFVARVTREKAAPDFESRLRRSDGTPVWVLENAALVESGGEEGTFIEGTVIDITRRKEVEAEVASMTARLIAAVERYRVLVESTDAVPWEVDGATLVLSYISPQAKRVLGYETEDMLGTSALWDLIVADDRARVVHQLAELAASGDGQSLNTSYRVRSSANQLVHVRSLVSAHARTDGDGIVLRGITFDMSKQRTMEMELQQAQKLESVGRLAAGVAHEINTPIQFIGDSLHFIRDAILDITGLIGRYQRLAAAVGGPEADAARTDVSEAEQATDLAYLLEHLPKAVERSLEGVDRVTAIVRSMKEFAHPDQKEMSQVDLNRAVQSTIVIARNEYKYVADVQTDLGDIPPVTCHGGDINQVLLNLIVNAAHAIGDVVHGTDRRGRIAVRTRQDGDAVVVSVSDTGSGIPEAIRDHIFDPFFTTKEVGKGTGQGLAIARNVVIDKHGGTITFETQTGVGTTFHVRLPIHGATRAGIAA